MANEIPTEDVWPTPALIRAARGLMGIGQAELANEAKCSRKTIILIESDESETMDYRRVEVLQKLAAKLEALGVEFVRPRDGKGAGIRYRKGPKRS